MIGYVHIPKSGGTSLREAFEGGGFNVWRPKGPRYTGLQFRKLEDIDVVCGHMTVSSIQSTGADRLITILRDPVDRFMSHYFVEAGRKEKNYWPSPGVVPDNIAARLLGNLSDPLSGRPNVEDALANLERFEHVGFTHKLDETFVKYELPVTYRRKGRRDKTEAPSWLVEAALERTQLDAAIYKEFL